MGIIKVKSITYAGKADVFNMEVEDTHNFVIQGGVIAHNCADMWRYFLMSRPIKPREAKAPDTFKDNPLNMYLDINKSDLTKRSPRPRMEILTED